MSDSIDSIRKRTGMYVGEPRDGTGALVVVMRTIREAYEHHLRGACTRIEVQLGDDEIVVRDDGPGMAGDDEEILARFMRASGRPTRGGLHLDPFSLAAVCALSSSLTVRSIHDGVELTARWSRGRIVDALRRAPTTEASGTEFRLTLDSEIFSAGVDARALLQHLDDLTRLSPGLVIAHTLVGRLHAPHGLASQVARLADAKLDDVVTAHVEHPTPDGPITIDLALAWRDDLYGPVIDSFANYRRTDRHGTHVDGLLDGVGSRTRGLVAAVAVVLPEMELSFGDSKLSKLTSPAARPAVAAATAAALRAAIARGVRVPPRSGS